MENRAAAALSEDPQRARWRQLDFFPTPPWAARAGAELLKQLYPSAECVWEPACGEGHMAEPLKETFSRVLASDIYDHGYGAIADFLAPTPLDIQCDIVVTNPPFASAAEFVRRGLEHAPAVALLCRLAFLEGAERYRLFYEECNLRVVAPFAERVAMQLGSWDPELSSATAYAWFVFERGPRLRGTRLQPIAPGAKARLSKDSDVRRFVRARDLPMNF
jgi:hypothetical protein